MKGHSQWSCLLCYENRKGRANHKGHSLYQRCKTYGRWIVAKHLKRPSESEVGADAPEMFEECELTRRFPALAEFLTLAEWEPGERREVGTILLLVEAGRYKAWVHDRDGRRSAWVSAVSLTGVLGAANKGLLEDRLDWRADREAGRGRGKRP